MQCKEENILIGGINQNILTLYTDLSNPILLIVHGGPGSPDRPLVAKYNKDLAERFTVVCWDQRCSGLSYTKAAKLTPISIELMISDLKELVLYLLKTYGFNKLYLAGHSWGAYLGLLFAKTYPYFLHYYIGTGQGISSVVDEIQKYNFVLSKAILLNDKKAINRLLSFGKPENGIYKIENAASYVSKLIHKYGGYIHSENNFSMKCYLTEYIKFYKTNAIKVILGIGYSVKNLIPEMKRFDFIPKVKELDVPIKLIFGEDDYICPVSTAREWFDALSADSKEFIIIKNAAHMVNFEQSDLWNKEVLSCIVSK